jgi:hypothetical protein
MLEALEDRVTPTILWHPHWGAESASYGNGQIIGQTDPGVPIYLIFKGSYWNTSEGINLANTFEQECTNAFYYTPYLDLLHQYKTSYRAFFGQAVFDYGDLPSTITDNDVQNALNNAIDNLGLPEPDTYKSEGVYFVITAPGVNHPGDTGYHTYTYDYDFPFDLDFIHYGWIGTSLGFDGVNGASNTLSHELAETMSDPGGITNSGWTVTGGITSSPGSNEIGDGEAQNYFYRLDGYNLQSLWSQADGAFAVSDGNSQNFWVSPNFDVDGNYLNNGTLTLYGDQFGSNYNDTITIITDPITEGVLVIMNGEVADFDKGQITNIIVYPYGGSNTINIYSTNVPVYVASSSNDTVNIGAGYTRNIYAPINIFNWGSATDTINGNDSSDPAGQVISVHANEIDDLTWAPIYYSSSDLNLYGGAGGNTWYVNSTSADSTFIKTGSGDATTFNYAIVESTTGSLNIDGGSSGQAVYVGSRGISLNGNLAGINGYIVAYDSSSSGYTHLYVDDSGDATGQTMNLYFDEITDSGMPAYINWITQGGTDGGVNYLQVRGGRGSNTFNVFSTGLSPWSYSTDLYTGTGGANVNIESTLGSLNVINQFGHDNVIVGSLAPSFGGTLANINGAIDVYGRGETYLYVDDSGDTAAETATLSDGEITGLAPANILWSPSATASGGVDYLDFLGGSGGNTFNVISTSNFYYYTYLQTGTGGATVNIASTSASGAGFVDGLYINNNNGQDSVIVGSTGTLANINGGVDVFGPDGSTYLYVIDTNDSSSKTATMSDGEITGLAPGNIDWTPTSNAFGGVTFLDVLGGSGGNTFNVLNTSYLDFGTRVQTGTGNDTVNVQATTGVFSVYNNGGNDTVAIGSLAPTLGGTLANINAYVAINGPGPVALIVDDSGDATGRAATLTRSASATNTLSGMSPAPIYYESNVTSLVIDGGSGNDSLTLAGPSTSTSVTYKGGGGTNTLVGPDTGSTFNITSVNAGTISNVIFNSVQNLVGGSGNNTFAFTTGGALAGSIDGGGGVNTLDYSAYAGDITVVMPLGQASAVSGGIARIQNVTGSQGNDLIVGDANPHVFIGGTGRNLIIGGAGLDQITGGSGDNILIGGTTIWDANLTALTAIFQEWTNTALGFDQRVNALRQGVVVNGVTYALNKNTVHADSSADNLLGGAGQNWFFVDSDDVIDNGAGPAPSDRVTRV